MNENGSALGEGNPSVERAEQQALGTSTYQKVEVVHRFADTHPWVHPALIAMVVLFLVVTFFFIRRRINQKGTE